MEIEPIVTDLPIPHKIETWLWVYCVLFGFWYYSKYIGSNHWWPLRLATGALKPLSLILYTSSSLRKKSPRYFMTIRSHLSNPALTNALPNAYRNAHQQYLWQMRQAASEGHYLWSIAFENRNHWIIRDGWHSLCWPLCWPWCIIQQHQKSCHIHYPDIRSNIVSYQDSAMMRRWRKHLLGMIVRIVNLSYSLIKSSTL